MKGNVSKAKGDGSKLGATSKNGGEIFNDYENNQALCEFSTAMGKETQAGMRAFRIISIGHYTDAILYEYTDENGEYVCITEAKGFKLDTVKDLKIGYTYSLCLGNVWNDLGKIVSIDAENNIVYVSNYPESGVLVDDSVVVEKPWENTLSINEHPELGTIDVGFGATATGLETIALRVGSVASGYQTKAIWIGSDAGGIRTFASFAAMARGVDCEAIGYYTYAGGLRCKVYCNSGFAHGIGLKTSQEQLQALFGQYNNIDDKALFIIGNGKGDGDRTNVFTVKKDGRAVLGAEPINNMDAVNKRYVDNEAYKVNLNITQLEQNTSLTTAYKTTKTSNSSSVDVYDNAVAPQRIELKLLGNDNLITLPYATPSHNLYGLSFTVKDDGGIHVKGTATGLASFIIKTQIQLKGSKSYTISGLPPVGEYDCSNGSIVMYLKGTSSNPLMLALGEAGVGICENITCVKDEYYDMVLSIRKGTVVDATFYPFVSEIPKNVEVYDYETKSYFTKRIEPASDNRGKIMVLIDAYPSGLHLSVDTGTIKSVTYNQRLGAAIDELKQAIISLGGNV